MSSTDFHTTNLVDLNRTITVINFRLPPMLLMKLRIPSLTHHHGRRPPWQINTNFRR